MWGILAEGRIPGENSPAFVEGGPVALVAAGDRGPPLVGQRLAASGDSLKKDQTGP